ncbi:hypothetical protein L1887_18975 [Cichorium endivia]|nr:hypothetical protein L1887_18975 [Cichorium endivia]
MVVETCTTICILIKLGILDGCLFVCFKVYGFVRKDGTVISNSSHQKRAFFVLGISFTFFDDIDIIPIHTNNHINQHHHSSPNKSFNITAPTPYELKLIKKRIVGKKHRHNKIHTTQGLRDMRVRLSLHIARKFFNLKDLLGFDKASKTIEWFFCKSNKVIKEVVDKFDPKHFNQSTSEEIDKTDWLFTECEVGSALRSQFLTTTHAT